MSGLSLKEAQDFVYKAQRPGSIFDCDDPKTFNFDKELGRAEGFISGHAQGVAEERKRAEGLVEALKPFEREASEWTPMTLDSEALYGKLSGRALGSEEMEITLLRVGDLRRAKQALLDYRATQGEGKL